MATRKPAIDNTDAIQDLDQFRRPGTPVKSLEPRRSRSRRGVTKDDPNTSQVCFRTMSDKHRALKTYCAIHDKEVGEVMDELLTRFLQSLPK